MKQTKIYKNKYFFIFHLQSCNALLYPLPDQKQTWGWEFWLLVLTAFR